MQIMLDNYIIPYDISKLDVCMFDEIIETYDKYRKYAYNPKSRSDYLILFAAFLNKNKPNGYDYNTILKEYFDYKNYDLLCLDNYDLVDELKQARSMT